MDHQIYSLLFSTIFEKEFLILALTKLYSQYSFFFYFIIIIYEFVLSVYVTFESNPSFENCCFPNRETYSKSTKRF